MSWTDIDWLDGEIITELKLDQLVANVEYVKEFIIPSGGIILWSGSVGSIPAGWYLCDGNNGTPDLRDKFVRGAGGTDAPLTVDGEDTHYHTLAFHTHTVASVNLSHTHTGPNHTHLVTGFSDYFNLGTDTVEDGSGESVASNNNANHRHSISIISNASGTDNTGAMSANAEHNHGGVSGTPSTNDSDSSSNIPVYMALCYIMKA